MGKQDIIKKSILDNMLAACINKGWSVRALEQACVDTGYSKHVYALFFPSGVHDITLFFNEEINTRLIKKLNATDFSELNTTQRIFEGIKARLELLKLHKPAVLKCLAYLSLPANYKLSTSLLWKVADLIWYESGYDKSTDFNYYSKRALLASVYLKAITIWLNDGSEGAEETYAFVERDLDRTVKVGAFLGKHIRKVTG